MMRSNTTTSCWGYGCFDDPDPSQLQTGWEWWKTGTMVGTVVATSLICFFVGQKTIQCGYKAQLIREREREEEGIKERKKFVKEKLLIEKWSEELEIKYEDNSCSICMEKYKLGDKVSSSLQAENNRRPCQHIFHTECIGEWLWSNSECPICRNIFLGSQESEEFLMRSKANENDEENQQAEMISSARQEQAEQRRHLNGAGRPSYHGVVNNNTTSDVARVERSNSRPSPNGLQKPRRPRVSKPSGSVRSNGRRTDPLDELSDDESESMTV